MRDVFTLSSWRWPQWLVVIGAAVYAVAYIGLLPPPHTLLTWLESQPEIARSFHDPAFGRSDALILLFSILFLGPLALLITTVFLVFSIAVLGGVVLPVVRWVSLPDWVATSLVIAGLVIVAWMERSIWLPNSLSFVGLLARALRIVLF